MNSVQIMSISHYTSKETLGIVHVPCLSDVSFQLLVQYAVLLLCYCNRRYMKLNKN